MKKRPPAHGTRRRRLLFFLGSVLLLYPIVRFIRFAVPPRPRIIEIGATLDNDNYLLRDEFIVFAKNDERWAVSRTCTHLGCRLHYKEEKGYLECPCHQSRFALDGTVLHGPAQRPLPRYRVEEKGMPATLFVTIQ